MYRWKYPKKNLRNPSNTIPIPVQSDQRKKESRDLDQIGERELTSPVQPGLRSAWVSRWVAYGGGLPGSRTVVAVGSLVSRWWHGLKPI